jgi:hypothetical protein
MGRDDIIIELNDIKQELRRIEENLKKIMDDQAVLKNQARALLAEESRVEEKPTKRKSATAPRGRIETERTASTS